MEVARGITTVAIMAEIPLEKMITSQVVSMFRGLVITKEIEEEREEKR